MPNERLTDRKIARELGAIQADINHLKDDVRSINDKLDIILGLEGRVSTLETKADDRIYRIEKLEGNQSKIVWALISSVLAAIMSLVINVGGKK